MSPPATINNITSESVTFWKPFTRIFQMLCVSHYFVFRPNLRNHLFRSLPFLIYFIIFSSLVISSVVFTSGKGLFIKHNETEIRFSKRGQNQLMYYINSLSIIGSIVVHVAIHVEALFCVKGEEKIYDKFEIISSTFATKFNHSIDYKVRRSKYIRQCVGTTIISILLAAVSSFTTLPDFHKGIQIHFIRPIHIIPVIIIRSRWCYFSIFLSAIGDTLKDLQCLLRKHQIQSFETSNNQRTGEKIRYFREIYSSVLRIIAFMSETFGWSVITFLIEFTFDIINASYWLYMNLHFYGSNNLNLRKM